VIPIPTLTVIAIQTALGQARPREDGVQLASEMYDRNNLLCMCVRAFAMGPAEWLFTC